MKTIALTLFAAALAFAQNSSNPKVDAIKARVAAARAAPVTQTKPPAPPPKTKPTNPQATVPSIPAGAKEVAPNVYRYTDSNGKTWNYRRTPFGITKWDDAAVPPQRAPEAKSNPVTVTDLGDSYRFEKKTPFGGATWVRKKTDLTEDEKAMVDHSDQPAPSAADPAVSEAANKGKEGK